VAEAFFRAWNREAKREETMGKLNRLLIDPKKDVDGVEFPYAEGVVFIVARWGNPRFQQELNRRMLQMTAWERRKLSSGEDDSLNTDTVRTVAGKHILVGWKNLEDADGRDIPYSEEYSVKLCKDPAFGAVYRDIIAFAQEPANYRDEAIEEISGNSPGGSSGSSSGASSSAG